MPAGIIVVRACTRDEEGRPIPVHSAGWDAHHDGQAFVVLRDLSDDSYLYARVLADGAELVPPDATRAVFFVIDPTGAHRSELRALVTSSALAWTPAGLRADDSTAARRVKAAIRDTRQLDDAGQPIGLLVGLRVTVFGHDLPAASERVTVLAEV